MFFLLDLFIAPELRSSWEIPRVAVPVLKSIHSLVSFDSLAIFSGFFVDDLIRSKAK